MLSQAEVYDRFLKKFTEEILTHLKSELAIVDAERLENERIKKVIEAEKLRVRFSNYTKNQSTMQKSIRPPIQQVQRTIVRPPVAKQPIKVEVPQNQPPISSEDINFGRINMFVQDPLVSYIDCPGENRDITIRKVGRIMKVELTLKKEEIFEIIKSFSEKTHIPLIEGMLKAKFKNLEIAAIVSQNDSSFVLKKEINPVSTPITFTQKPRSPKINIPQGIKPRTMEMPEKKDKQGFFNKKITLPF